MSKENRKKRSINLKIKEVKKTRKLQKFKIKMIWFLGY